MPKKGRRSRRNREVKIRADPAERSRQVSDEATHAAKNHQPHCDGLNEHCEICDEDHDGSNEK